MSETIGQLIGTKQMSRLRDDLNPADIVISTFCGPADINSSTVQMVQLTFGRSNAMHLTKEEAFELAHLLLKAFQ